MGFVFQNGKFVLEATPGQIEKSAEEALVLRRLRSYLDAKSPALVRFLVNLWNTQGQAITYKELREAILRGEISADLLDEWRQDYANFITQHLDPAWRDAMADAVAELERKYPDWYFNPMAEALREWTEDHSAEFVTLVTDTQIDGLRSVVRHAASLEGMTADRLARVIRPMVGLYRGQTIANLNYYHSLIAEGMKEERARALSIRYSARQHRYRGMMIARQELALAYNAGAHEGTKQAQAAGYMGEVEKYWSTSMSERRCEACRALEGAIVGMDQEFNYEARNGKRYTTLYPPLHPQCMCAVEYREVSPPMRK